MRRSIETSEKETEKPENYLIEGCINDKAKEVISQMLERRLAELDSNGLQAKFIIKLQNELNQMPTCKEMFAGEEKTE